MIGEFVDIVGIEDFIICISIQDLGSPGESAMQPIARQVVALGFGVNTQAYATENQRHANPSV